MKSEKSPWPLIPFIVFFFAITVGLQLKKTSPEERKLLLSPPPEHIEHMQFGFKESAADSIWLRWIQDADVCYTYLAPAEELKVESADLVEGYTKEHITFNPRHKICDNSWAFKMLDAITKLDPKFQMPYTLGAVMLSVLVEDFTGASVIFERGLKTYPEDWSIAYRAAYHFLYDRQDVNRAAELLDRAEHLGGPFWLKSLAARLYTKTGQLELGISALETYRKSFTEPEQIKEIDERIANLRRQLADQPK